MRKPIRPFAVETRRAGRKPLVAKIGPSGEAEAPKSTQPEWPPMPDEDDSYVAAMRAADALFSRPAPEPVSEEAPEPASPSAAAEPARRILQSLNEDDHITRMLAEEDEHRPRRGRKAREPGEPAPIRAMQLAEAVEHEAPAPGLAVASASAESAHLIPGYVRGQIYGRYARHNQARPGEQWRKRSLKPLW
jgi:hypothetical protein